MSERKSASRNGRGSVAERERLADVAELYWVQGLKVEMVGRRLGMSRSTVSRLLARAREEHVIEFVVHRQADSVASLRTALQGRYGITVSVPLVDDAEPDGVRRLIVGHAAAAILGALMVPDTVLDVAWGATVEAMSSQLRQQPLQSVDVVQFHGSGNIVNLGDEYAGTILGRFGSAFGARVHLLPMPAVFDSPETREVMWQETSVRQVLDLRASADLLVTSVGTADGSHLYDSGYISEQDMQDLADAHVVGNVGSVFFRADGSSDGIALNERCTGIPLADLRRIPRRLFVVADKRKAVALDAALRTGLATHLVVDPGTARALVEL